MSYFSILNANHSYYWNTSKKQEIKRGSAWNSEPTYISSSSLIPGHVRVSRGPFGAFEKLSLKHSFFHTRFAPYIKGAKKKKANALLVIFWSDYFYVVRSRNYLKCIGEMPNRWDVANANYIMTPMWPINRRFSSEEIAVSTPKANRGIYSDWDTSVPDECQ